MTSAKAAKKYGRRRKYKKISWKLFERREEETTMYEIWIRLNSTNKLKVWLLINAIFLFVLEFNTPNYVQSGNRKRNAKFNASTKMCQQHINESISQCVFEWTFCLLVFSIPFEIEINSFLISYFLKYKFCIFGPVHASSNTHKPFAYIFYSLHHMPIYVSAVNFFLSLLKMCFNMSIVWNDWSHFVITKINFKSSVFDRHNRHIVYEMRHKLLRRTVYKIG